MPRKMPSPAARTPAQEARVKTLMARLDALERAGFPPGVHRLAGTEHAVRPLPLDNPYAAKGVLLGALTLTARMRAMALVMALPRDAWFAWQFQPYAEEAEVRTVALRPGETPYVVFGGRRTIFVDSAEWEATPEGPWRRVVGAPVWPGLPRSDPPTTGSGDPPFVL
jgi:hypothetical protein